MQVFDLISEKSGWDRAEIFAPVYQHYSKYFNETADVEAIKNTWRNLVSMDAALSFDPPTVTRIKEVISETVAMARGDFPLKDLTLYLAPMSDSANFFLERLNGVTGYAYDSAILLSVNPYGRNWESSLQRILLHECNHVARYPFSRHHERFLDWIVAEGLAELYVCEKFPDAPKSPWIAEVSADEIDRNLPRMRAFWSRPQLPPNAFQWMYGSPAQGTLRSHERPIPAWLGYAVGFRLASAFRRQNPTLSWNDLIRIDSLEFDPQ